MENLIANLKKMSLLDSDDEEKKKNDKIEFSFRPPRIPKIDNYSKPNVERPYAQVRDPNIGFRGGHQGGRQRDDSR